MATRAMPAPLNGIRVLDFTSVASGPISTRYLADYGAEVIKVEPPEGDPVRVSPPLRDGRSPVFGHVNAGKKSIVLNLKSKAAIAAAMELCKQSHVVVENWRPGTAARLGIGYEQFVAIKPDIIYCSVSGYGQSGPRAQHAAYAGIIHAMSGYDMVQMAVDQRDAPPRTGIHTADVMSGIWAFTGILGAVLHHRNTGKGQYIDVAMLDTMLQLPIAQLQEAQFGAPPGRPQFPLRTTDGFILVLPLFDRNFDALTRVLGHPEWHQDERFNSTKARHANWMEFMRLIESFTEKMSMKEAEKLFQEANVPCGLYRELSDAMRDPQTVARGSLATVKDGSGEFLIPHLPFQVPGLDISPGATVPELGADTEQVLGSLLGYSAEQIRACQ